MNFESFLNRLFQISILAFLIGCASESLTPDIKDVKVSKESPSKDCREIGRVTGSTPSSKGTSEEALKDMVKEASKRSANYLRVDEYSSYGGSVTGTAFRCP